MCAYQLTSARCEELAHYGGLVHHRCASVFGSVSDANCGIPSLCPRSPVDQALTPRLAPIIRPQLAGIGARFSELLGALWPGQRHVAGAEDAQRSRLVAPLLAVGLPTLESSGMPLSMLGIAISRRAIHLQRRFAQLPRVNAVLQSCTVAADLTAGRRYRHIRMSTGHDEHRNRSYGKAFHELSALR